MSAARGRRTAASGRAGRRGRLAVTPDAVVLGLAVAIALVPLVPVYGVQAVAPGVVGGVLLGSGIAAVAARRRWLGGLTAGAVGLAYVVFGGALAMPTAAAARVLPTLTTTSGVLGGAVSVWKEVLTLDPELGSSADVLVAPYLLALAGSAAAVTIAARSGRRAGAWAGLLPFVVLGVALLLGTQTSVRPGPAGVALVGLLLPWAAWHRGAFAPRRVVSLAVVAAAMVTAGLVAAPSLVAGTERLVVRDDMVPPFDARDHPSPLSSFRAYIKDWRESELLRVSGLPEGARVRLATMDAFDGVVWNVAGSEQSEGSGSFRRVGETIDTDVEGRTAHVEFEALDLPNVWLPTVGYAQRFTFDGADAMQLAADLRYNDATGTAVLTDGVPAGTRWSVDTVVPAAPAESELEHASLGAARLPALQGVPEAVLVQATAAAQSASSPALIALSLQDSLAQRGYFSHGVEDGETPSLSGHGADRITTLLTGDVMVGDGEQYASAMALMARQLGLPARVVLGFVPDPAQVGADDVVITGDDVQAWVEIQFAGIGWVSFDPTPDESRTPRQDEAPTPSAPEPQVRQPPPPLAEQVNPPEEDTPQPRTEDTGDELVAARDWTPVVVASVAVGVPVLLLVAPVVVIAVVKRRRRRRRRTVGDPVARVAGGWQEVLDEARDLRRAAPASATRREAAVQLSVAFARPASAGRGAGAPGVGGPVGATAGGPVGTVGGTVADLALRADAAVFGPGQPVEGEVARYWQQVDAARRAMWTAVPRWRRLTARWAVGSLRAPRGRREPTRR